MIHTPPTIYADSGITFREIMRDGKLGGSSGLMKYLEARQSQLMRNLSDNSSGGDDEQGLILAVAAMREAIDLVGLLSKKPV